MPASTPRTERPLAHPVSGTELRTPESIGDWMRSSASYDFANPTDIPAISGKDSLLPDLIETRAVQRLKDIRFLGGIDYCLVPSPNGSPAARRYTRYQHSIGVLGLASLYCTERSIGDGDRRLIYVSALLHDVGHSPLSHSLESVFKEAFDIEHHQATEDIICGRVPLGKEVFGTLRRHGMNVEEVVALVSGKNPGFGGFFHGPISFDTIEGILRSYMYVARQPIFPNPEAVIRSAMRRTDERDRATVDEFWRRKDEVYRFVINSRTGILSDLACRTYLKSNIESIGLEEDYFGTEREIFRKLPGLRSVLEHRSFTGLMQQADIPVFYQARKYYVDPRGDFFACQDGLRYRHERRVRTLPREGGESGAAVEIQQELFHDGP